MIFYIYSLFQLIVFERYQRVIGQVFYRMSFDCRQQIKEAAYSFLSDQSTASSDKTRARVQELLDLLNLILQQTFQSNWPNFVADELLYAELNHIIKLNVPLNVDYPLFQGLYSTVDQRCRFLEYTLPCATSLKFSYYDRDVLQISAEEYSILTRLVQTIPQVTLGGHLDDANLFKFLRGIQIGKLLFKLKLSMNIPVYPALLIQFIQSVQMTDELELYFLKVPPRIYDAIMNNPHLKRLKLNVHLPSNDLILSTALSILLKYHLSLS